MSNVQRVTGSESSRHFSNVLITWEIRRFTLITRTQILMCTPRITVPGPFETQWMIYIDLSLSKNKFLIKLEMLPNETLRGNVEVHWSSFIIDGFDENLYSPERVHVFDQKSVLVVDNFPLQTVLDMLSRKIIDSLVIKCRMLIDFGMMVSFPNSRIAGVAGLSNDLCGLPVSFLYHDITTSVQNVTFSLHRAMLYQRSKRISDIIEQSTSDMKVNFNFFHPNISLAIFKYLYSGDLRFILAKPSLTVAEYLKTLEIPELIDLYSEQRVGILSEVELISSNLTWKVIDFKNVTMKHLGPELRVRELKCRFRVSLTVIVSKGKKTLYLEIKLLECEKMLAVCVDFVCRNGENKYLVSQRMNSLLGIEDKFEVEMMTSDDPNLPDFFSMDILIIDTTFYIRYGDVLTDIVVNIPPVRPELTPEKSFGKLMKILGDILKSKDYSDCNFMINGEKIKAHKFLVASRSSMFKELFRRHEGLATVNMSDIQSDVFHELLSYMYMGIIRESNAVKLMELYRLGEDYNVTYLQEIIVNLLVKLINEINMLQVLLFAYDKQEPSLKTAAFNYVVSKYALLNDHPDCYRLKATRMKLYDEIKEIATSPNS